jgi:anti-sigma factor ChrR (cupin superfamily)
MTHQTHHNDSPDDGHNLADLAMDYALGHLSPAQAEAFEAKLVSGDARCVAAFQDAQAASDALLNMHEPVKPDLITRSNLIKIVCGNAPLPLFSKALSPDAFAEDAGAMVSLSADSMEWKATEVPGVKEKRLYVDKERKRMSLLLKLDPGVEFPDHDHPDVEECLVLEGDLDLGGITLRKHDYMRIPKSGRHGTPRTTNGCLLLVTCGYSEVA